MKKYLALAISAIISMPAFAGETRTITDDSNTQVEVPVKPKSIGGLYVMTSMPLYELGAPLKASATRPEVENG